MDLFQKLSPVKSMDHPQNLNEETKSPFFNNDTLPYGASRFEKLVTANSSSAKMTSLITNTIDQFNQCNNLESSINAEMTYDNLKNYESAQKHYDDEEHDPETF